MDFNQSLLDCIYNRFYTTTLTPDGYLLKNHREISYLLKLMNSRLPIKKPLPFLESFSKKETINFEREFLASLNLQYKRQFNHDYRTRHIVSQKKDYGKYIIEPDRNDYKIYYPETFFIKDFITLTHEYIHHLSFQFPNLKKESSGYRIYCEMLALLGELKALDFLQELGISEQEIECFKNNKLCEFKTSQIFLLIEPLLSIFLSGKSLTEDSINILLETNQYYKALGKRNLLHNLNWLLNEDFNKWCSSYVYSLGLAWASSLHQDNISNDDFVKLIEVINTVEVTEFEKIFPSKNPMELASATEKEFSLKKVRK